MWRGNILFSYIRVLKIRWHLLVEAGSVYLGITFANSGVRTQFVEHGAINKHRKRGQRIVEVGGRR